MNTQTEAMKLALEALEESQTYNDSMEFHGRKNKAIAALRKALTEQPAPVQQELVAGLLVGQDSDGRYVSIAAKAHADTLPLGEYNLYTSPPAQRKPLTDDEIDLIVAMSCKKDSSHLDAARVARAIEAAHNIKD